MQQAYKKFLRDYRPLIRTALRTMDTDVQRIQVKGLLVTAFAAGYRAPRDAPTRPPKLRRWRGRNTPQP